MAFYDMMYITFERFCKNDGISDFKKGKRQYMNYKTENIRSHKLLKPNYASCSHLGSVKFVFCMKKRVSSLKKLIAEQSEQALWEAVIEFQGYKFKTYSGLIFSYSLKKGRNGSYTRELFIDRRENSKSLAWSSVLLAFKNIHKIGAVVKRPKALGDIRGVTYIYAIFYRFGLIDVPENVKMQMN